MNDTTAAHEAATIEAMHTGGAIPSPLWTENQRLLAVAAELREQVIAAFTRAERAESEAAGLRAGYADLQAALTCAAEENANLRAVIAGIAAHGGPDADERARRMNQWLVSPAGGSFGPWPGVVEAGSGRVIAHVVPDEATAQELVGLRAALVAAVQRAEAAEEMHARCCDECLQKASKIVELELALIAAERPALAAEGKVQP